MRLLIFGRGGQVGSELVAASGAHGIEIVALDRDNADFTDQGALRRAVHAHRADVVINAAAYTAVDKAESEAAMAFALNADAPRTVAEACRESATPLIHISTDYVFDGQGTRPYREDDPVAPLGVYGRTKLAGETAVRETLDQHVIVRTAWIFSAVGSNFVKTMLRLAETRDEIAVVDDQRGCPTAASDLALALLAAAQHVHATKQGWGTYHYCGAGETTWHDFAAAIFAETRGQSHRRPRLRRITTAEYPTPARRPAYSVLDCAKFARTFAKQAAPWLPSLRAVIRSLAKAA